MKRVIIYCEGPTEETFITRILAPALSLKNIFVSPSSCRGVSKYSRIRHDLNILCRSDTSAIITTMLDYYALPKDTPGMDAVGSFADVYQQVTYIEESIKRDLGVSNLIPNLTLHEFEALLFSQPDEFSYCNLTGSQLGRLQQMRDEAETPEHINNNPHTAPSKRILRIHPQYNKVLDGYNIANNIGLHAIRQECKHFDSWVRQLEALEEV